jgi:hypothetical protein
MDHVSRPLIALLVASVAFFAVWTLALKPNSSNGGGSGSSGAGSYQSAIDKAHQAVTNSNKASVAHGATIVTNTTPPSAATATTPATGSPTTAPSASATRSKASASASATATKATAKDRSAVVTRALRAHKVVALLFFNPLSSDDRAVQQELTSISAHSGKVVKLAVPLDELSRYKVVSGQVPVSSSPTLVLIDRAGQASTIVGYASSFEIAHRIDDALAAN